MPHEIHEPTPMNDDELMKLRVAATVFAPGDLVWSVHQIRRLLATITALTAERDRLREECAWIRKKLDVPPDATSSDVYGRMHVWDSHQHGYLAYIAAYKCHYKQGEIARLSSELHAAHREVQQLAARDEVIKVMREALEIAKVAINGKCVPSGTNDAIDAALAATK